MNSETNKPALTWILAIGGGLAAGASMSLFEQGMAKVIVPAILVALFAFASTFFTRSRKRTAFLAWVGGSALAGIAASVGRYLELTAAAQEFLGADAAPAELAAVTEASLADANLGLTAVVLAVVVYIVAALPVVIGAVARPKAAPAPQLGSAA